MKYVYIMLAIVSAGAIVASLFLLRPSVATSPFAPTVGGGERSVPDGMAEYRNERFGFSLLNAESIRVNEYEEAGTLTVTFQYPDTNQGFQIYILPYSEETISDERFRKDVPSGVMQEPQDVLIDGVRGTMFFSRDSLMGETREVWFTHDGYLYEVTTFKALDAWLSQVMQTWQFIR